MKGKHVWRWWEPLSIIQPRGPKRYMELLDLPVLVPVVSHMNIFAGDMNSIKDSETPESFLKFESSMFLQ